MSLSPKYLAAFRASGCDVADVSPLREGPDATGVYPGRVYADWFYIVKMEDGRWLLELERDSFIDSELAPLEELLAEYAWDEGVTFDDAAEPEVCGDCAREVPLRGGVCADCSGRAVDDAYETMRQNELRAS